ncbi:MAG: ParB/RepB/Spo0J family partition protein [Endomicrobiales bacterium]|nr:ParB/RepB/Spo0J family partition protein [Endomicrobiales bacterium]
MDLSKYKPQKINLADINTRNTAFKFRKEIDERSLAESFRKEGQKFPIVLWKRKGGTLQVISGFRRIYAAYNIKQSKILAVVIPETELNEEEALKLNFIENRERKSLNKMDLIFACKKLSDKGKTVSDIARIMNIHRRTVNRYMKVANAPKEVQQEVLKGKMTIDGLDKSKGCAAAHPPAVTTPEYADLYNTIEQLKADTKEINDPKVQKRVENLTNMVNNPEFAKQWQDSMAMSKDYESVIKELKKQDDKKAREQDEKIKAAQENILESGGNQGWQGLNMPSDASGVFEMLEKPMVATKMPGGFDLYMRFRKSDKNFAEAIKFLSAHIDKIKGMQAGA